jgi:catalase
MTDRDRADLVGNIVSHLSGAHRRLQLRQSALFYRADKEYGGRVAEGLGLDIKKVKSLASMTQDERVRATLK